MSIHNVQRSISNLTLGLVVPFPNVKTSSTLKAFFQPIERLQNSSVSYIQLWGRNKDLRNSLPEIRDFKHLADQKNIPIIVNNCIDVAEKLGLPGVHLGQKDEQPSIARKFLGKSAIIGLTVNTQEQVVEAQKNPHINYLGAQVFPSLNTKPSKPTDTLPWGLDGIRNVIKFTKYPVVVIGGINLDNLPTIRPLLRQGDGVAIAGAIMRASDPSETVRKVNDLLKGIL